MTKTSTVEKYQNIRSDSTTFMMQFINNDTNNDLISFQDKILLRKRIAAHLWANLTSVALSIPLVHYGYPLLNKYEPEWLKYFSSKKYIRYGVFPFLFVVTNYALSEKCLRKNYEKLDKKYNFTYDDYCKLYSNFKQANQQSKQK